MRWCSQDGHGMVQRENEMMQCHQLLDNEQECVELEPTLEGRTQAINHLSFEQEVP
jgi:hypothetical protein